MSSRDHTLALVMIVLLVLGVGGALGFFFVYQPIQDKADAAQKLQNEIDDADAKIFAVLKEKPKLDLAKRQSLPPDEALARREYKLLLERLLQKAKLSVAPASYDFSDGRVLATTAPVTPDLPVPPKAGTAPATGGTTSSSQKKPPAYRRLEFKVNIKRADIWQIADFLAAFYQTDLLHQITDLRITRDNKPTDARNGLEAHITIEAIIVDGTPFRATLFPPEPKKGSGPALATAAPVLAKGRDYSLLALNDLFYGLLPPPKPADPFKMSTISDVVLRTPGEPPTVKLKFSGDGADKPKVIATASGTAIPEGALKIDQKSFTLTLPASQEELGSSATSTISVVATAPNGVVQKGSFTVSLGKAAEVVEVAAKDDIAAFIKLSIMSGRSDGTVSAIIWDAANPHQYKVTANIKAVVVDKWWLKSAGDWRKDRDYEQPAGVLAISDDSSATKRTFQVVAFEDDAILVLDVTKPVGKADAKLPGKGGGFGGPGGFGGLGGGFGARPPVGGKQGPADPLAALMGNASLAVPLPPPAILYRWSVGKSLKDLKKVPPEEASKLLKRVATEGPLGLSATPVSSGNE